MTKSEIVLEAIVGTIKHLVYPLGFIVLCACVGCICYAMSKFKPFSGIKDLFGGL